MDRKKTKYVCIWDIMSLYFITDMIKRFRQGIGFSNTWHEKKVVLEPCSKMERVNMAIVGGLSSPYFYFYLLFIHELEGFIPFTSFEEDFFAIINITPSQIMPNVWSIIRVFPDNLL